MKLTTLEQFVLDHKDTPTGELAEQRGTTASAIVQAYDRAIRKNKAIEAEKAESLYDTMNQEEKNECWKVTAPGMPTVPQDQDKSVNAEILAHHDPAVRARALIELKIVRRLLRDLKAKGFTIAVDDGDGEDQILGSTALPTEADALKLIFNLDEATLYVTGPGRGWVRLVMGNDGWDVICDYTTNLDAALQGVNEYSSKLERGAE